MKVKIIWVEEVPDDQFSRHLTVDSGDGDEVTDEEFQLLAQWSYTFKRWHADAYPLIIAQDLVDIKQRIVECRDAIDAYKQQFEKEKEQKEKAAKKVKAEATKKARIQYENLKRRFERKGKK